MNHVDQAAFQAYRIYNTWMGDPTKLLLLEKAVEIIKRDNLLENVASVGSMFQKGLRDLEVRLLRFLAIFA